jgi:hypothetical protein
MTCRRIPGIDPRSRRVHYGVRIALAGPPSASPKPACDGLGQVCVRRAADAGTDDARDDPVGSLGVSLPPQPRAGGFRLSGVGTAKLDQFWSGRQARDRDAGVRL